MISPRWPKDCGIWWVVSGYSVINMRALLGFAARVFLLLGLLAGGVELGAENPRNKQVLILHSYHLGYVWTSNIHDGILETLKVSGVKADIRTEYLDWKHFPTAENLARQFESLKAKYRSHPFHLVITSDNIATEFALKHREELFPGAPIAFCGYNGFSSALIKSVPGVTGVAEHVDAAGTLEVALQLLPHARRVLVVCDGTETGRAVRNTLEAAKGRFQGRLEFEFLGESHSTEEVIQAVDQVSPNTFILIGPFNQDHEGRFLDLWELPTLLQERGVKAPVFHLYEEALGHGSLGGSLMGGHQQGEAAGHLIARILQGEDVGRIPVMERPTVRTVVDFREMQRLGISESRLHSGWAVLNPPRSFYERNKGLVLGSLALSLLAVFGLSVILVLRMQAEGAVRRSEARLRTLVQHMPVLICAFDSSGNIIVWNRACELCTGYSGAEVAEDPLAETSELLGNEARARLMGLARGEGVESEVELGLRAKNGEMRIVRWFSESRRFPIPGWAGWVVGVDVTRQLEAEEQLRRSQRMESLGTLAGGIAHDFGNLLTAIQGSVQLLEEDGDDTQQRQHHADVIARAARRGTDLVKQLMGFARAEPATLESVDIHEMLGELRQMLERTLPRNIDLEIDMGATSHRIRGDGGQIMQMLLNLALNARDAMPSGGRLSFITQNRDEQICITVQDTGAGMSPEVQRKIFEPFFTTKAPGKGTGMGLAMTYSLVQNHGGQIRVESEFGRGTTFYLSFPLPS